MRTVTRFAKKTLGSGSVIILHSKVSPALQYTQRLTFAIAEISRVLGERWKVTTDREKRPYEAKAAADKKRYEREMALYKSQTQK